MNEISAKSDNPRTRPTLRTTLRTTSNNTLKKPVAEILQNIN